MIDVTYTYRKTKVSWKWEAGDLNDEGSVRWLTVLGFFTALCGLGPLLPAEGFDGVKKSLRQGGTGRTAEVESELADVFTYLVLLADELGVDLIVANVDKAAECERRWGGGRR